MKKSFYLILVLFCCVSSNSFGQSLKDLFSKDNVEKAINTVTGVTNFDLVGTWTYTGSAIEFDSDNIVKKAGGAVASATIEKKVDEQLSKFGLKENMAQITFASDSTFSLVTPQKTIDGKYVYDKSTNTLDLDIIAGKGLNPTLKTSGDTFSMLFNADKLIDVVSFISTKIPNSTIKSINSIVSSYDGMKVGLEFTKSGE